MAKDAQSDILSELLRRFSQERILDEVMLIGSWCLAVYRSALAGTGNFPVIRTLDADFLIPNPKGLKREVDIPVLLKELGFVPTHYRSSGWVVYDHSELRVEFLIPELGRGSDSAHEIKKLHVKAQGLRYLNLLADHPRRLPYTGLSVCVPEPAAFALQKLIISERRLRKVKRQRDVDTAVVVLDYVFSNPSELNRLKVISRGLPAGWLKTLVGLAGKNHEGLSVLLSTLRKSSE